MGCLSEEMIAAVIIDDADRVAELLAAGFDVDARNERGETAFSYACAYDAFAVARLLVRNGTDVNTTDSGNGRPLDWAVCQASPEFREWLIGAGGLRNQDHEPWPWPPKECS